MNAFHNPYHFVPLRKDREHDEWIDAGPYHADKRKDNPYLPGGHSRYEQGRHKGRIRCTLITETPVFIGARRYQEATETNPARVAPYELGGQPAIPATTLRGMISSIAEAASYSAMRVLDVARPMSYRATTGQALKKLGMIISRGEQWFMLELPGYEHRHKLNFTESFQLGGESTSLKKLVDASANLSAWYYRDQQGNYHLKGKRCRSKGKFRVMDANKRVFPESYKHRDFFVEFPQSGKEYEIPPATIETFHAMCDEIDARSNKPGMKEWQLLPYHPLGTQRNLDNQRYGTRFRIKNGDLLFYALYSENQQVSFMGLSAIWRKTAGSLIDFMPNTELLPFNGARQRLSPAERVFGFVEDRPKGGDGSKDAGTAYAGHVRFSHARWDGNLPQGKDSPYGSEVILKILDSPKPPSPALYFRKCEGNSGYIAKQELDPDKHEIQGRKFYLHQKNAGQEPWRTRPQNGQKRLKQKTCITPLHDKLSFSFEVEYDNLTEFELGMLLYALSPNDSFRHKIGMGKPLGLGSVKIGIDEVVCHDPLSQYRGGGPFGERCEEKKEDWGTVRDAFRKKMMEIAPATVQALETLGDPNATGGHPVHYPQKAGKSEAAFEEEHYRWWVKNDHKDTHPKQHLAPLDENEFKLKPLKRN